jgi:hypothetical protein
VPQGFPSVLPGPGGWQAQYRFAGGGGEATRQDHYDGAGGYVDAADPGGLAGQPRWFRSPPMAGIKDEGTDCHLFQNYDAQAPDGLFLVCIGHDGVTTWVRGDT